jgi:fumarate reductase flavoprotein subunit
MLAKALGAAVVGLDRFYGHVLAREAFENDRLSPFPWADPLATHGIVVDARGRRFVDERQGGVVIANAIARLEDPLSACAVFDDAVWNTAGKEGAIPPNPNLELAGATIHKADTLAELTASIGLPPGALGDAVKERYAPAQPRPPFRALRLAAGITYTMGGIAIDRVARVLDASGTAIPRLYAAGSATGGIEGGPGNGYVGGLAKAGLTGLWAADHIARKGG